MGLITLCNAVRKIKKLKEEANIVLANVEKENNPSQENKKWRETYRLNTVACSSFIANQLCNFEGKDFDFEKRSIAYLGSASACISDDIIDKNTNIDSRAFRFLDTRYHSDISRESGKELFYSFHSGLEKLLPEDFGLSFKTLIERYNHLQEWARDLRRGMDSGKVLEIKNGTGGYPILLLHKMMFPEYDDISQSFSPDYRTKENIIPKTKDNAIFNYGALISRIDDLSDLNWDLKDSRKSLATEGLVTWKSLKKDVNYVKHGLQKFYPKNSVDSVMKLYSAPTMHLAHIIENLIYKIKDKK